MMNFAVLGSPDRFEKLCKLLLLKEHPSIQTIDGRPGDEGKDSFLGTFAESRVVFQIKYFTRLGSNQRQQIEASLEQASTSKPTEWILLVPLEFTKYDWKWFEELCKKYHPMKLDVWQGPKIASLVIDKKNEGLLDLFPELYPISARIDSAVTRTIEKMGIQTYTMATSLVDLISNKNVSEEELARLVRESRTRQYSGEIVAAQKWLIEFDNDEKALRTLKEVYAKAVSEDDAQNELSAIYGILDLLGNTPEPDVELIELADRGMELASRLSRKDALALIEAQKARIIHLILLLRHRQLAVSALVMNTTGTLPIALPVLRQEEQALKKLGEESTAIAVQAGAHAFESGDMRIFATVMMQIGSLIGLAAFQYKAYVEDTKIYEDSARDLLENAAELLRKLEDKDLLAYAENNLAVFWWSMANKDKAETHAKLALELASKSKNKFVERRSSEVLKDLEEGNLPHQRVEKTEYTPDVQEQMLRFVVRQMGVDIQNPRNEIDKAVKVGIKDLNPERILKFCQYMKVDQASTSFLGQMIGVPTLGPKRVSCVKVRYSIEGFDLDSTFDSFKRSYCDSCKFRKPRDPSWKWTFDWEKDKNREYENLDL